MKASRVWNRTVLAGPNTVPDSSLTNSCRPMLSSNATSSEFATRMAPMTTVILGLRRDSSRPSAKSPQTTTIAHWATGLVNA